ncbi:MAG: LAGLIDADG family homing endonuclease [Candidatus Hodarchaeota archaeon]
MKEETVKPPKLSKITDVLYNLIYATKKTWRTVYNNLKEKGHSLNDIKRLIGSQFRNQLYHGYGIREDSFQKLETLVGYSITTIPYPFSKAKSNTDFKLKIPHESNLDFIEFIGILLGDGHLSKYTIDISLSNENPKYITYVSKLIKKLFDYDVKSYKPKHKKLIHFRIHSILLVQELIRLGLKCGNKVTQQVGVPNWIQNNTSYSIACVRGLIDTDGYLYRDERTSKNYTWVEYHVGFVNHSQRLLDFIEQFCDQFQIKTGRQKYRVVIRSNTHILKFLHLIKPTKIKFHNFPINKIEQKVTKRKIKKSRKS